MKDKNLLKVENLRLSFHTQQGTVHALRGVNFHLNQNEIVGLIGESGCGKSLTAQSLLQLWPKGSISKSGQIIYEEKNLLDLSDKEMEKIRGNHFGMIFQDPNLSLNPTMKIGHQLTEGLRHHRNLSKNDSWKLAEGWLSKVGLQEAEHRMHQYPHELSGGMKQRVMIAMAMICHPSFLIADEPTTALDVTIQAQILELFKVLRKEHQTSILLITHDLGVVARCCDRVMVMLKGEIIETADVDQLFSSPQHPYTKALLKSKRSLTDGDEVLYTLEGLHL
jgi:oligopeptide transport system ATP-binding protein